MALILRFDKNHDYVDSIIASVQTRCGPFFCVAYRVGNIDPIFLMAVDLLKAKPPVSWSDQIKNVEDLPNKIKTYLLLGGLDYAITSTNNT